MNHNIDLKMVGWRKKLTCTYDVFFSFFSRWLQRHFSLYLLLEQVWIKFIYLRRNLFLINLVNSQHRCTFDRPILGDYYSYENGLETHTSFKLNGDIDRLFYRRQSGLGANANIITVLDNRALGECYNIIYRANPAQHISKHHYELIYRDK